MVEAVDDHRCACRRSVHQAVLGIKKRSPDLMRTMSGAVRWRGQICFQSRSSSFCRRRVRPPSETTESSRHCSLHSFIRERSGKDSGYFKESQLFIIFHGPLNFVFTCPKSVSRTGSQPKSGTFSWLRWCSRKSSSSTELLPNTKQYFWTSHQFLETVKLPKVLQVYNEAFFALWAHHTAQMLSSLHD